MDVVDHAVLYFLTIWLCSPLVIKFMFNPDKPFALDYFKSSLPAIVLFILYLLGRLL